MSSTAVPVVLTDLSVDEGDNHPPDTWIITASTRPSDNLRALGALLRREQAQFTAVASASSIDLGAITTGNYGHVTGTTTITSFGTVAAGIERTLVFDGILTLTHNATSLILATGANRTTAAGDVGVYVSEGSGNWREKAYHAIGSYQPLDALLTALAAQTTSANKIQAYSGADTPTLLTTGTSSGNVPLVGTKSATTTLAGLVELAIQSEAEAGTDNTVVMTPLTTAQAITALATSLTSGTAVATTSGTSIDLTGIPAGTKRINLLLNEVSLNGVSNFRLQLGVSGTPETSGYAGQLGSWGTSAVSGAASSTSGVDFVMGDASWAVSGRITLSHMGGNLWIIEGMLELGNAANGIYLINRKTLAGVLDMVRLTTVNGTDAFDAGSINIFYE
jgi:hypothetical protein